MATKTKTKSRVKPSVTSLVIRVNAQGIRDIADAIWAEMQIQGLSYAEVAEKAGVCEATVRKLIEKQHSRPRSIWVSTIVGCLEAVGAQVTVRKGP